MLYREETETVSRTITQYVRAKQITIDNSLGLQPQIHFQEERVLREDGLDAVGGHYGDLSKEFTMANADTEFDLLHPDTGEVIGTAMYRDLQVILHSLYFHLATERDNAA